MITILREGTGTCGLCRKPDKDGVRCEVEGIGSLFLDWRCLRRMVALKSGGSPPQPNGVVVEAKLDDIQSREAPSPEGGIACPRKRLSPSWIAWNSSNG